MMDEDMNILSLNAGGEHMHGQHTVSPHSISSPWFPLLPLPAPDSPLPPRGPLTLHPSVPCEGVGAAGVVSLRDSCSCWSTAGRPAHPNAGKGWSPPPVHAWFGGCCTSSQRGQDGSAPGCVWCWWPRPARPARPSWGSGVARWDCRRPLPPSEARRRRNGTAPARRRSAAGERCSEPWRRSRWRGWTAGCRLTGPQCGWTGSTAACCRQSAAPLRQENTQKRAQRAERWHDAQLCSNATPAANHNPKRSHCLSLVLHLMFSRED